jgi:acyl dehydratase
MTTTVTGIAGFESLVGEHLGWSEPLEITQERVNTFADATGDHQWIHVDPERAKSGPFGGPIAHGYLTLSLGAALVAEVVQVEDIAMAVNYGMGKVRFPAPVPVGSKLRMGAELSAFDRVGDNGGQATFTLTFEVVGAPKPSCVAEVIFRYYE